MLLSAAAMAHELEMGTALETELARATMKATGSVTAKVLGSATMSEPGSVGAMATLAMSASQSVPERAPSSGSIHQSD